MVASEQADGRRLIGTRNRRALLEASATLFAQRGYRGTTTRDIAAAANITERTLFRQFSSKAALFREAVITPVEAFVTAFTADWNQRPRGSRDSEIEVREFYASLLKVIDDQRSLLLALVAALAYESHDDDFPDLQLTFAPLLDTLAEILVVESALRDWTIEPRVAVRLIVGMALSISVHRDWLFADEPMPRSDHLVDQLTRFTIYGLPGRSG